jgi:bifunctional DNA-binding transcriptional regulator/antitoxin component of YhaV-PrlF toxin-antitoxin module
MSEDENVRDDKSKDREARVVIRTDKNGGAYVTAPAAGTIDIRLTRPKITTAVLGIREGEDYILYRTRQEGVYILVRTDKAAEVIGARYLTTAYLNNLTSTIMKARLRDAHRRHRHRRVHIIGGKGKK